MECTCTVFTYKITVVNPVVGLRVVVPETYLQLLNKFVGETAVLKIDPDRLQKK